MTSPIDPGDPDVRPPFWRHRYYYLALKIAGAGVRGLFRGAPCSAIV